MDGETRGGEAAQVELAEGQEVARAQQQAEVGGEAAGGSGYEALLAKRDERIAELEAQVAVAARSAEAAEALRSEIEAVKAAAADERVEYELRLCFVNLSFHKTASVRFTRQREDSSRASVALAPILSSPTTPRA